MNKIGCSYYLGGDLDLTVIEQFAKQGCHYVFTSLQIPEESYTKEDVEALIETCARYQLALCADVSPYAMKRLGVASVKEAYAMGFACLRFDYGISMDHLKEEIGDHQIMINASNVSEAELLGLLHQQIDAQQIIAVHNYYPKPHTGLSMAFVKQQNDLLHSFGIETVAFIPGFQQARGPLYRYLPTVEHHRNQPALQSAMELVHQCNCDSIIIGDPLGDPMVMDHLQEVVNGIFILPVVWRDEQYQKLLEDRILHHRFDESEETIRIQESRMDAAFQLNPPPVPYDHDLDVGDLMVSNLEYARYCNEIEIVRRHIPHEPFVNHIGCVHPDFHTILPMISSNAVFKLIHD